MRLLAASPVLPIAAALFVLGAFLLPMDSTAAKPAKGIDGLKWMAGSWKGDHDGGLIEEHWTAPNGRSMIGMSRLVIGERTAFFEFLRIEERPDGSIVYLAQPRGRAPAVPFTMTSCEVGSAVFENPDHDYPKVIRYSLSAENVLTAITEGEENGKKQMHESVMKSSTLAD